MPSIWENAVITNKGMELQAKLMLGGTVNLTSVKVGAGSVPVVNLKIQTAVSDIKQTATVQTLRTEEYTAIVPVLLTNQGVTEEYYLRQVGFYATDPDEGEILYAIAQNTEPKLIPTDADMPGFSLVWNFYFNLSNEVNMTATITPAGMATMGDLAVKKGNGIGTIVGVESGSMTGEDADFAVVFAQGSTGYKYNNVFGKYAKEGTPGDEDLQTVGDVAIFGNGTSELPSNSHRFTMSGETLALSSYQTQGADYAEFFEWKDGNTAGENRAGLFVTMDGDKIIPANEGDFILGVITRNPSVVGNADEDYHAKWLRDDFGDLVTKDGSLVLNPIYDKTKYYLSREIRPEWDPVGMVGVVPVFDDGTCQINGFCKVKSNGIATSCNRGVDTYRVIKRVNENLVKIVLK